MPDYRKQIDDAKFQPNYANDAIEGPGDTSPPETWTHDVLDQSSAQQLADLLGAKLVETKYDSGPFQPAHRQWQLDFGADSDDLDASLLYDTYRRSPDHFNGGMAAMLKPPGPVGNVGSEPARPPGGPGTGGGGPQYPPGSSGGSGTVPGPGNWPSTPPPNVPGPGWTPDPLPGRPDTPAVELDPTTGVKPGGGFTAPPKFQGSFPMPLELPMDEPEYTQIPGLLALQKLKARERQRGLLAP